MFAPTKDITYPLTSGLDLVSSHFAIPAGALISCNNIETVAGEVGYRVPTGWERTAGDILPSETLVNYFIVESVGSAITAGDIFVSGDLEITALDTIASPADGDLLAVGTHDTLFSASLVFTNSGNTFTISGFPEDTSSYTTEELRNYVKTSIEFTRERVELVPGLPVGGNYPIDGGFRLRGSNYTFSQANLYRGNGYGWDIVTMPNVLRFREGTGVIKEGVVVTNGTANAACASYNLTDGVNDYELEAIDQGSGYLTLRDLSDVWIEGDNIYIDGQTIPAFVDESFDDATKWTLGTGASIATSKVTWDGTQTAESLCSQEYVAEKGTSIQVVIIASGITAGSFKIKFNNNESTVIDADGTFTEVIVLSLASTLFSIVVTSDFIGSIESVISSAGPIAVADADAYLYVLIEGGKYETAEYNFSNLSNNSSVFGTSGVQSAFEFNGVDYIPIFYPVSGDEGEDDVAEDIPSHVIIHQERLFLAFPGGQMTYSVSGKPRINNPLLGSGVWSTGFEITGMRTIVDNVLIVTTSNPLWVLSGDGIYSDATATRSWRFFDFGENVGALEWSLSGGGVPVFASGSNIKQLVATNASGGFFSQDIMSKIQPLLEKHKDDIIGAMWHRDKSQYRLYYSSGFAIYISFRGASVNSVTTIKFPSGLKSVWTAIENEDQVTYFITDTGYLYKMDSGNTFDDEKRVGFFRMPFYNYGKSRIEKLFSQLILEFDIPIILTSDTSVTYSINVNFGSSDYPKGVLSTTDILNGRGGFYDDNDGYGAFVYGSGVVSEIEAYLDGYGANMSILVSYETQYDESMVFKTATVDFIELGRMGQT